MNLFITQNNIKPADTIFVRKSIFQVAKHYVVYLGKDFYGKDWLAEYNPKVGMRLIGANQFFAASPKVLRTKRFAGNNADRELAVKRTLNKLGQLYSLINFNAAQTQPVPVNNYKQQQTGFSLISLLTRPFKISFGLK